MSQKVLIKSAGESFRRAGIQATREGTVVEVDSLTEEQVKALRNERMISIAPYEEPEAAADDKAEKAEKADKSGKAKKA